MRGSLELGDTQRASDAIGRIEWKALYNLGEKSFSEGGSFEYFLFFLRAKESVEKTKRKKNSFNFFTHRFFVYDFLIFLRLWQFASDLLIFLRLVVQAAHRLHTCSSLSLIGALIMVFLSTSDAELALVAPVATCDRSYGTRGNGFLAALAIKICKSILAVLDGKASQFNSKFCASGRKPLPE